MIDLALSSVCFLAICCGSMVMGQDSETQNAPQRPRQTRAEIEALARGNNAGPRTGFTPRSSRPLTSSQNTTVFRQASANNGVYPYPAAQPPRFGAPSQNINALSQNTARVAQQPNTILPGAGSNTRGSGVASGSNSRSVGSSIDPRVGTQPATAPAAVNPQTGFTATNNPFRQSVFQAPTLTLSNTALRTAQNCVCAPTVNQTRAFSQAPFPAPAITPNAGSGTRAPTAAFPAPGQPGSNFPALPQPGFQPQFQPGFATPQFGAQGARWWTPFVTGSGIYTPLIRLQNMPPGTYLGQGLIGQPTAYVDGQPLRNLLRYLAP